MYLWKTDNLVSDLKKNQVTEKDKLKYVILLGLVYTIFADPFFSIGVEYSSLDSINLLVTIFITIFGTIYVYKKNSNGDNSDFITRITCLSVPIGIKIFILAFLVGILVGIIEYSLAADELNNSIDEEFVIPTTPSQVIMTFIVLSLFYFQLGKRTGEVAVKDQEENKNV